MVEVRVLGGFKSLGSRIRSWCLEFRVSGVGLGFGMKGFGFRV